MRIVILLQLPICAFPITIIVGGPLFTRGVKILLGLDLLQNSAAMMLAIY